MYRLLFILCLISIPSIVLGAESDKYIPLIKELPGWNSDGDLGSYLNALFNIAVLMGSILAVLIIASAGLQYMTTDAVTKKKDSIGRIQQAVLGLLMLLGSYLLFNQINPEILKFKYPGADTSSLIVPLG